MVKIWCREIFEDRPYNPNFPFDRKLGLQWRRYLFEKGSELPTAELSFKMSQEIEELDYFEGDLIPVASEKLKNVLMNEVPDSIDFYPVNIIIWGGEISDRRFYTFKVKDEIECFDWEKSNYETQTLLNGVTRIIAIRYLALLEDKIKDRPLFRIAELNYFLVGIRKDLCEKILGAGVKGIEFKNLDRVLR